jgi:bacteriocin biosynthesis cyclodehydratase domain-containing protein
VLLLQLLLLGMLQLQLRRFDPVRQREVPLESGSALPASLIDVLAARNAERTRVYRFSDHVVPVRYSAREYRLASLFDAVAVTAPEETGAVLDEVIPALAGGATLAELAGSRTRRDGRVVRRLVRDLVGRGVVVRSRAVNGDAEPRHASQRRFFANFEPVAAMHAEANGESARGDGALQRRLASATVMVVGLGRVGSRVCAALAAAGVGALVGDDRRPVTPDVLADSLYDAREAGEARADALARRLGNGRSGPAFLPLDVPGGGASFVAGVDLVVLCEDQFDPDRHAGVNRACIAAGVPWIGYRLLRTRLEIGPTVVPRETACYHCYEVRRASNDASFADELAMHRQLAEAGSGFPALDVTLGSDLLALEALKTLTGFTTAATYGAVFVLDVLSLAARTRPLLKVPRCPECGIAASKPAMNVWRYDDE